MIGAVGLFTVGFFFGFFVFLHHLSPQLLDFFCGGGELCVIVSANLI